MEASPMPSHQELLSLVGTAAASLQQQSREIVDNYFDAPRKTEAELWNDVERDRRTLARMQGNYDRIMSLAGQIKIILTRDTPRYPELLEDLRQDSIRAGLSGESCTQKSWEASYTFPSEKDIGDPWFHEKLTEAQIAFYRVKEHLRLGICRSWTAFKDLEWRLRARVRGVSLTFNITGPAPALGREDAIDFPSFTAHDPFVPPVHDQGHSTDSLSEVYERLSVNEPGNKLVAEGIADTIYVDTSDLSTPAPSQSPQVRPQRKRKSSVRASELSGPVDHVVGVGTQAGWASTSHFGLPASAGRFRHSTRPASSHDPEVSSIHHR